MDDRVQFLIANCINIDLGLILLGTFGQHVKSAVAFFTWDCLQAMDLFLNWQS